MTEPAAAGEDPPAVGEPAGRESTGPPALARLAGLTLPSREGVWDLEFADGRIAAIRPGANGSGLLALPGFAEPHCHADRAFAAGPRRATSLVDAIRMTIEQRDSETEESIRVRARRLLERALGHGATRLRSHVDVDLRVGLKAVAAVAAEREAVSDRCAVELVAFAGMAGDPAEPEARDLLRRALAAGADLLGGVPTLYADPRAATGHLLSLAAEAGVGIDLHVDETLDEETSQLSMVLEAVLEHDLAGRVTISHCCVLAALPAARLDRVLELLVATRAVVAIQPALNLYLQDRRDGATPRLRGVALARELLGAGVPVRFGSDNVRDIFYPYGDADPLEAAFLAAISAHVEDEGDLLAGICGGAREVAVGAPADLVVLAAADVAEALATRPDDRAVLRGGRLVAGALPDDA